jgi:hypothetical protein
MFEIKIYAITQSSKLMSWKVLGIVTVEMLSWLLTIKLNVIVESVRFNVLILSSIGKQLQDDWPCHFSFSSVQCMKFYLHSLRPNEHVILLYWNITTSLYKILRNLVYTFLRILVYKILITLVYKIIRT